MNVVGLMLALIVVLLGVVGGVFSCADQLKRIVKALEKNGRQGRPPSADAESKAAA